jgi:hypothetical protein
MIDVRQHGGPTATAELSGVRADLVQLRDAILRFCKLKRPILEAAVDPTPSPGRVAGLRFVRTESKVRVEVEGGRMLISGRRDHLEALARSLPCDAEPAPAQVPFDAATHRDHVQPDSVPLVLLRRKDEP